MGDVIKFISRKEFVAADVAAAPKWVAPDLTKTIPPMERDLSVHRGPDQAKLWLNDAEKKLSEDDYLGVLESIISPDIYTENDAEVQELVDGFFALRNVGLV